VFEHNNILSGFVILLKRMTRAVWSIGDLGKICRDTQKILLSEAWALSMTVLIC